MSLEEDKDTGKSWAKPTCKYYKVCGDRFNCKDCKGYVKRRKTDERIYRNINIRERV